MFDQSQPEPQPMPEITLRWNAVKQDVEIKFSHDDVRTWNFVIGILNMALEQAQDNKRITIVANMKAQAESEQFRRALRGG